MKSMSHLLYHTMSARTSRLTFRLPDPVRLLMCWSFAGICLGAFLQSRGMLPDISVFTQGLAVSDAMRSLRAVFLQALCPVLLLLGGILLSGCAAFGQCTVLTLLLSRGFAFGCAAAQLFVKFPVRDGIVIAAVLMLPFGFLSTLLLCRAAKDALLLANHMTTLLLHPQSDAAMPCSLSAYLTGMLTWALLSVCAAGLHTLLLWQLNDRLLTL